jgi:vacuolar-type H+-ATPase subunit E/Vma4
MALDEMLAALEAETCTQCEEILAEARETAARVVEEAKRTAQQERALATARARESAEAAAVRITDEGALAAERLESAARARAVEAVFDRAAELIETAATGERAAEIAAALAREATAGLDGGVVVVRPAVADAVRSALGDRFEVRAEADAAAGALVIADEGRLLRDDTMPTRLARVRERFAADVAASVAP